MTTSHCDLLKYKNNSKILAEKIGSTTIHMEGHEEYESKQFVPPSVPPMTMHQGQGTKM